MALVVELTEQWTAIVVVNRVQKNIQGNEVENCKFVIVGRKEVALQAVNEMDCERWRLWDRSSMLWIVSRFTDDCEKVRGWRTGKRWWNEEDR